MWVPYNPNPCRKSLGDCAVRAVAVALGLDWYEAFDLLCDEARRRCDMPSADETWGEVLMQRGFDGPYLASGTAAAFCRRHPRGVFVLAFGGHVATVVDGDLYDLWDSSGESVRYYYRRT